MPATTKFDNALVKFTLLSGEFFSIIPQDHLNFDPNDIFTAEFELVTHVFSRKFYDCVFVENFADLKSFLAKIGTASVGDVQDFITEDRGIVMSFTRQKTGLRISGRSPIEGYLEKRNSNVEDILERRFATQTTFYCDFPLEKVPTVVGEMSRVLQIIEDLKSSR